MKSASFVKRWACWFAAALLMGQGGFAPDAAAQDREENQAPVKKQYTLEVDEDGRVTLDGKVVGGEDGPLLLRIDPDDGDVTVVDPADRVFFGRGAPGMSGGVWVGDDFDFPSDAFQVRVPRPGRVMEELAVIGDLADGAFGFRFEQDEKLIEMERESRELAREARRAEGGERERLEQELRTRLNQIFDRKMEKRAERLAEMEEDLQEARSRHRDRQQARDEIVERRLRDLLGERDQYAW